MKSQIILKAETEFHDEELRKWVTKLEARFDRKIKRLEDDVMRLNRELKKEGKG